MILPADKYPVILSIEKMLQENFLIDKQQSINNRKYIVSKVNETGYSLKKIMKSNLDYKLKFKYLKLREKDEMKRIKESKLTEALKTHMYNLMHALHLNAILELASKQERKIKSNPRVSA